MKLNNDVLNKRKHVRNNLIHDFEVIDKDTGAILGDLADITIEGIMLICDAPMEINKLYHLQVNLEGKVDNLSSISVKAKTVRCIDTDIDEIYSVGFQILEIDPSCRTALQHLIDEYGLDYNKS